MNDDSDPSVDDVVELLLRVFPEQTIEALREAEKDDLWQFHMSIGQWMRNEFLNGAQNESMRLGLSDELSTSPETDDISSALVHRMWLHCQGVQNPR